VRSVTGDQYRAFWNSMLKLIQETDTTRNQLAHGLVILHVEGAAPRHLISKPVAYWIEEGPDVSLLTREDVISFSQKTKALTALIRNFGQHLRGIQSSEVTAQWDPIFATAVQYPFPAGHPLAAYAPEP